jgi:hypothetical protein
VPIQTAAVGSGQQWPVGALTDGGVDCSRGAWRQRDQGGLVALAHDADHAVSVGERQVGQRWRPEYGPDRTRFPIARLRYTKSRNRWSLYWRDRNLKFHEYELADPTPDIQDLLDEIDRDPTSIFWG